MGPGRLERLSRQAIFLSGKLSDVVSELALEVGCFILRDALLGSEAVKHSGDLDKCGLCFSLVSHLAKIAHGVAGSLCVVAVAEST